MTNSIFGNLVGNPYSSAWMAMDPSAAQAVSETQLRAMATAQAPLMQNYIAHNNEAWYGMAYAQFSRLSLSSRGMLDAEFRDFKRRLAAAIEGRRK